MKDEENYDEVFDESDDELAAEAEKVLKAREELKKAHESLKKAKEEKERKDKEHDREEDEENNEEETDEDEVEENEEEHESQAKQSKNARHHRHKKNKHLDKEGEDENDSEEVEVPKWALYTVAAVVVIVLLFFIYSLSGRASEQSPSGNVVAIGGNNAGAQIAIQKDGYQEIRMDVLRSGWSPNTFVLKRGVPVKWRINGKELNGCNSGIKVSDYGLSFRIQKGEQTIEFTPTKEGTVSWSCLMGMIRGTFIVKNDISNTQQVQQEAKVVAAATPKGASCGGGGGCGCGG